jgi:hypothetical protein
VPAEGGEAEASGGEATRRAGKKERKKRTGMCVTSDKGG